MIFRFLNKKYCLLIAPCLLISGHRLLAQELNPDSKNPKQYSISFSTGDKIPGDVQNGVAQLQRTYSFLQKFRALHNGSYPSVDQNLLMEVLHNPLEYGLEDRDAALKAISSPDDRFNDLNVRMNHSSPGRNESLIPTVMHNRRPDGSEIGGVKAKNTHDVLAVVNNYQHDNVNAIMPKRPSNPVGMSLVLLDDGSIEKVPYDSIFSLVTNENQEGRTTESVFPNQAGVPWDVLTYTEYKTLDNPQSSPPIGTRVSEETQLPLPDNGVFESLVQLSRLQSFPNRYGIDRSELWKQFDPAQAEFTLADVQAGAAKLKLPLELRTVTLDELQKLNAPAIILTSDDKRLVTVSALDESHAIVIDRGMTFIVPRETLAGRYDGKALLPQSAQQPAQVLADDAIRANDLQSLDDEVTQQVQISNTGTQPLTLQIERPIPGVTEANLSADSVAPGQSATLTLKMKWREVLKTPTQNVLVMLDTNDPVRPRLPLGFLLRAPKP